MIGYEVECNNILAVGSPRIDQEEVEALKRILKLKLIEELAEISCF